MIQNCTLLEIDSKLKEIKNANEIQKNHEIPKLFIEHSLHQISQPIIPHQAYFYNQPPYIRPYTPPKHTQQRQLSPINSAAKVEIAFQCPKTTVADHSRTNYFSSSHKKENNVTSRNVPSKPPHPQTQFCEESRI